MSSLASISPPYRLTFLLPDSLAAFVAPGIHQPCLAGCLLTITRNALVTIDGRTRGLVFEQASRFFRLTAKDRPAFMVSSILVTPDRRKEAWEIAVNARVVFTRDFAPVIVSAAEIEASRTPHGQERE
jgi:hypothetical protein